MSSPTKILIIGGYGAFGALIASRLAKHDNLSLMIAGRNTAKADRAATHLRRESQTKSNISAVCVDALALQADHLINLGIDIVINASGPFQQHDYRTAEAAIVARCHYIDLADARKFVTNITSLNEKAQTAGVLVVSGASSVPGLSSAVVAELKSHFETIDAIHIGISPGNRFDPGLATTQSVLGNVGKPFESYVDSQAKTVYGWQGLERHGFPEFGNRWMGYVELPDIDLFPQHMPDLKTITTKAGVEVGLFHLSLWALSGLVRSRIVSTLRPLAKPLLAAKRRMNWTGTDIGGMFVTLEGTLPTGAAGKRTWHLTAKSGDGPFVPTIASVILATKLANASERRTGAMPCFELFTLSEFTSEVSDLAITCQLADSE